MADRIRHRRLGIMTLGLSAILAACASPAPSASPSADPGSTPEPSGPNVRLVCGGETPFPAELLVGPGLAETSGGAGAQALRAFLAGTDGQSLPQAGWVLVSERPDRVEFVAPNPTTDGWSSVALVRQGDGFVVDDAGDCQPTVVLGDGLGVADWRLDPAFPPPVGHDTAVHVLLREVACASGATPADRLEAPIVVLEPEAVLITLAVRQRPGGQDCQSNPEVPLEISLEEGVGNRRLFDAGTWPPQDESAPADS